MIHFKFFSKKCKICHKESRFKHNFCNNCLSTAETLIFENIKHGVEIRTGNPEMDLFCRIVIATRKENGL